ncbi:MAG: hypothetical protein V4719_25335 [Planctomycetota bacterium]
MSSQTSSVSLGRMRQSILALMIAGIALFSGCQQPEQACSISGQVRVDGQSAGGVYLIFQLLGAESTEQGTTAIRTDNNGAFASQLPESGEYSVTAFWPKITVTDVETIEGEDRFKGRYRDAQKPILSVAIFEGKNSLPPIELSSK